MDNQVTDSVKFDRLKTSVKLIIEGSTVYKQSVLLLCMVCATLHIECSIHT